MVIAMAVKVMFKLQKRRRAQRIEGRDRPRGDQSCTRIILNMTCSYLGFSQESIEEKSDG